MKFPTPYYEVLRHHFRTDPKSAHVCTKGFLSGDPSPADTSATRMSEALCLATGLLSDRAMLLGLADHGDGKEVMLGRYGYKTDMCAHGMARGAADLAYFLVEHWGRPMTMTRPTEAPDDIKHKTGTIAFLDIDGERAQGHIDIWHKTDCVGEAYWNCRKALFWKLD